MAWTPIPSYSLDQPYGYQDTNELRGNIMALADAPVILKTPLSFMPNAQALSALASGYVKNTTGTGVLSSAGATIPMADVPASLKVQSLPSFIVASFASPGSGIATGFSGVLVVPWNCTITQVMLLSSDPAVTSGSIVLDFWKNDFANYPPVVGNSICGSAKPTISSGIKSVLTSLTGWSPTLLVNDILAINVVSVTALTRVRIDIQVVLT